MSGQPAPSPPDFAPGLERAFSRAPVEQDGPPAAMTGAWPGWLRGSWYLNGPGDFQRGAGQTCGHWLDGDGLVAAVHFGAGTPRCVARYVKSERRERERQAGRRLFRSFGTSFSGDRLVQGTALASPANVSTLTWDGRLLALGEQGRPYELDPLTLETRGVWDFGGALGELSPFSAHPKLDRETGELWNFGVAFGAAHPLLTLYRFAPSGWLLERRRVSLDAPYVLHDFALSRNHAIFHLSPYVLDMETLLLPGATLLEALRYKVEQPARLLLLGRADGRGALTVPLEAGYALHTIQACEDSDDPGLLHLDVLELSRPVYDQYRLASLFVDAPFGRPVRLSVDLREGRVVARHAIGYELAPDFAVLDPRAAPGQAEELWFLGLSRAGQQGRKFFDQLVHARWSAPRVLDRWQAPSQAYLAGEPCLVPGPSAGRGALLCPLYDALHDVSALLAFDPQDVARGPVASLRFAMPLPLGFHAAFVNANESTSPTQGGFHAS